MDVYLYDSPPRAFIKWGSLFITYLASIIFKEFTIEVVMPTVFLYLLSCITDYADVAFVRTDKSRGIKNYALGIFIGIFICIVVTFAMWISNISGVKEFLNSYYGIIYLVCAVFWAIPLIDGVKAQTDKNRKEAVETDKKLKSDAALNAMKRGVFADNSTSQNKNQP